MSDQLQKTGKAVQDALRNVSVEDALGILCANIARLMRDLAMRCV
jgi:archaellum biogenesis protein FlaJ (TadC family)